MSKKENINWKDRKNSKKNETEEFNDQIEGRNAVLELLESGKDINKIYITKGEKHGSITKIIAKARERKIVTVEVEREKINQMAQTENAQGVIAIVPPFEYVEISDILEVAKERILDINPNANVEVYQEFFMPDSKEILDDTVDYIVDSVDTVTAKV